MKKVLLTGANGFIGIHTIGYLIDRGFEVHAVCHANMPSDHSNIIWHQADLLDNEQTDNLMAKIKANYLLHLAWYTTPGIYRNSLDNFKWLQASINLTISFVTNGGKRAVFAGSCAEYDWSHGKLVENKTPASTNSPYSACKDLLHSTVKSYSEFTDLSYAWGRLFFLFGPHEKPGRLVPDIIRSILNNQVAICKNGDLIRDYLYVDDAADAFVTLLDSTASGPFNIASGNPVSIKEITEKIREKIGSKGRIDYNLSTANNNEHKVVLADINRLTNETGWRPKTSLDNALDNTIAWWKK